MEVIALYSMVLWFRAVHGPGGSSEEVPHQMDPGHWTRCALFPSEDQGRRLVQRRE